jgi:hypothetical protein
LLTLRPYLGQPIRIEDFVEGDHYLVRAELAGIDPEKDVEVTVGSGYLTIRAERHDKTEGKHRTEFRYGSFSRSLSPSASRPRRRTRSRRSWSSRPSSVHAGTTVLAASRGTRPVPSRGPSVTEEPDICPCPAGSGGRIVEAYVNPDTRAGVTRYLGCTGRVVKAAGLVAGPAAADHQDVAAVFQDAADHFLDDVRHRQRRGAPVRAAGVGIEAQRAAPAATVGPVQSRTHGGSFSSTQSGPGPPAAGRRPPRPRR